MQGRNGYYTQASDPCTTVADGYHTSNQVTTTYYSEPHSSTLFSPGAKTHHRRQHEPSCRLVVCSLT